MANLLALQRASCQNIRIGCMSQQVMDDSLWSVFQYGWRQPWGADVDHIKEIAHLASFVSTSYTIDPSDDVDNEAQMDDRWYFLCAQSGRNVVSRPPGKG